MPQVTKSLSGNIEVLSANGLSTFVDDNDGLLKIKDTNGIVQPITDYTGGGGGGIIVVGTGTSSQSLNAVIAKDYEFFGNIVRNLKIST